MSLQPNYPVENAGLQYINGLQLAYVGTTSFSVATGQTRDSTNINDIKVTAALTVSISASGVNGLDTGTIAASTLYYVFAIGNSCANDPTVATNASGGGVFQAGQALISLSRTAPVLPTGFDMFKRIGAIRVNGSTHVEPFNQTGLGNNRTMRYQAPVAPGSASTAGSTTYTTIGTLTALVPQIACEVLVSAALTPNSAGNVLYLAPYGNTAIASNGFADALSAEVTGHAQQATMRTPGALNAAGTPIIEVDYATTSGSDTVAFLVVGYVDQV